MKIIKIAIVIWIVYLIAYNSGYKKTSDKDYMMDDENTPPIEIKSALPDSIKFYKRDTSPYKRKEVDANLN